MNEQEFRKYFRKGVLVCLVMGVLILAIGISAMTMINGSWERIVSEEMENESAEFKRRILYQVRKDEETLESLSEFLNGYSLDDADTFSQRLYDANVSNSFVSMAYFDLDGMGIMVNRKYGIKKNLDYRTLDRDIQQIIENAYQGEEGISSVNDPDITDHQTFVYAVPYYDKKKKTVLGVVAASSRIDVFEELISGDKVIQGKGAVHLVSSNGQLLISSYDPDNSRNLKSVLYSSYFFDYDTQQKIKGALSGGESLFCSMSYEGKKFRVYLYPLGINDWYLMCVHNQDEMGVTARRRSQMLGIIFASLFTVIFSMLAYMMWMNWKNTRSLIRIAYEDPLTNADNMVRFTKNLTRERHSGGGFSLVALNVHQFKFINEVLGVEAADDILRYICTCLIRLQRKGEFFCRDSADLFFIFLRETDREAIHWEIEYMMREVSQKAVSGQKDYNIRMYAGVLVCSGEEEDKLSNELLITRARFAMQHARKEHKDSIHFYDADVHKKEEMENYVENRMHQALENGEFRLFLQPKIDLKTGKLSSAEALVRWITAEGQMIFPDVFIPLFERNGFCIQLDLYMFEQACKQIRQWLDAGVEAIPISVNQSKLLFFDSNYISNLEDTLDKYRVPASMITLEILESLVLGHADEMNRKLRRLRDIGFKISMDDFGSGYSSFNSLGNLEIDELKLDRAFLLEGSAEKGERFKTILSHIIGLTKSLNITTVAEGVETVENEALIQSLGCDYGQGYLYSRPVSAEEFSGKYFLPKTDTKKDGRQPSVEQDTVCP